MVRLFINLFIFTSFISVLLAQETPLYNDNCWGQCFTTQESFQADHFTIKYKGGLFHLKHGNQLKVFTDITSATKYLDDQKKAQILIMVAMNCSINYLQQILLKEVFA
jgi:hypothetical protein